MVKDHSENLLLPLIGPLLITWIGVYFNVHNPIDRVIHNTYHSLCYLVVEHWLELEISKWVYHEVQPITP